MVTKRGSPNHSKSVRATVIGVYVGIKSPYVKVSLHEKVSAKPQDIPEGEWVTFSLESWLDIEDPKPNQIVAVSEFRLFTKGWRALSAKPVSDTNPV